MVRWRVFFLSLDLTLQNGQSIIGHFAAVMLSALQRALKIPSVLQTDM